VRIVLAEQGLGYEADVLNAVRSIEEIRPLNPNLTIPVLLDGAEALFETNLIIDYLLATYPVPTLGAGPPMASFLSRPGQRWEDAKTLATLESMGDSIVNLALMKMMDGVDSGQYAYLQRQTRRIGAQLDWLEGRVTAESFIPGYFSIQDISLIRHTGFADISGVVDWRGRPGLDPLVARNATRPSVRDTARPANPPQRMAFTVPGA